MIDLHNIYGKTSSYSLLAYLVFNNLTTKIYGNLRNIYFDGKDIDFPLDKQFRGRQEPAGKKSTDQDPHLWTKSNYSERFKK